MAYGVYIHLPFCKKKCNYCDFLSFPCDADIHEKYVSALTAQIKKAPKVDVDSIFIGGGTPSLISEKLIFKIMHTIFETFNVSGNCETTIELNPATVDEKKLMAYREAKINRISIGVQSFIDSELKLLGRLHSAADAKACISLIKKCGFENFNADLMFAIPTQTKESLSESLNTLLSFSPAHISAYSLIIEENTNFFDMYKRGKIKEADEDLYLEMHDLINETLAKHGYNRYEISNHAKTGFECRHNLKYWSGSDYFGFGLGAVGFIGNKRYENTSDFEKYLSGKDASVQVLDKDDLICEYIITGLRKTSGFSLIEFEKRFKMSFLDMYDISKFEELGLVEINDNAIRLTEKGLCVSNEIMCHFV